MKKFIALLLAAAVALTVCGCAAQEEKPEPTAAPTETPVSTPEPTPSWDKGVSRTSTVGIEYCKLSRGDEVNVIASEGDYYKVERDGMTLYVEKCFVRLDTEDAFTPFTGYGVEDGCQVFYNPYMSSAAITGFDEKQAVNVIDRFGIWMLVEIDGIEGCTPAKNITDTEPKVYTGGSYSGGGTGGGGGSTGGGSGNDGGDIVLGGTARGAELVKLADYGSEDMYIPFPNGHGVILADGVEAYLRILCKGESYMVTTDVGKIRTVYDGEYSGTVPGWTLNMNKDSVYIEWDGYAAEEAQAFDNYRLIGNPSEPEKNTPVHVVYDIGTCYLVTVNGTEYYMPYESVSETEIEERVYHGGGGGSTGGGGSSEWSEPVL